MRILMYGWEFPPHISGGLGVACFGMTQALAARGVQTTFVLPRLKEGMSHKSHVDLVGVSQFPITSARPRSAKEELETLKAKMAEIANNVELKSVDSLLSPYLTEGSYMTELRKLQDIEGEDEQTAKDKEVSANARGFQVEISGDYGPNLMAEIARYAAVAGSIAQTVPHDVIHAHDWLTVLAGIEAKRVSGKPLVVHAHALEFDRSGENVNQMVYDIERLGMEKADRVVAVSYYTKDIIVRRYGINPDKVEVVHNAVVRDTYNVPPRDRDSKREKVVLFLGRITYQKGPDYFVEAAAKVLRAREDVRFVMAGSGDMAPRVIERVAQLGIGRRFHFTGFLNGAAVEKMYLESDIYVMPSVSEPFGISPLEAMRYDVPVIISRQSGVSEILKHALKVDFWDIDELANKMLALLDHTPLREEIVSRASKELEGIQWDNAARRLGEVYESVAGA